LRYPAILLPDSVQVEQAAGQQAVGRGTPELSTDPDPSGTRRRVSALPLPASV